MINQTSETNPSILTATFAQPDRFGEDEELIGAISNRLSLLSASPTNQKDTGSAPYIGIAKLGKGDPANWLYSYEGISSPIEPYKSGLRCRYCKCFSPSIDGTVRAVPLGCHKWTDISFSRIRNFESYEWSTVLQYKDYA